MTVQVAGMTNIKRTLANTLRRYLVGRKLILRYNILKA
jgi:hypothetical protein